ncbi:valine--tRNA ligase [Patescibacteria group bacterium]
MPPPNATGTLHLGHAAMLALEDILIRYHRMKGDKTVWIPGTDHASIATQTKVEKILKEEGKTRHDLGRDNFLKRVNEYVDNSRDIIRKQIRKMGSSCDWSREAYTLDKIRTKAVRTVFKMMYDDGLIYRGERVVNWCPRCHSTLADDEVEYKSQKAKLYTFKYSKDFPFAIATTRPETKLGDTAVAVNPKDKRYKKYIGKTYEVDFCGIQLKLKIIADRNVDMEFGTGALGVTPAHSMVDWKMAEENDLDIIKVIDENGNIKDGFNEFSGKSVEEARKLLVNKLCVQGLIEKEEELENNLSLCYRCNTPIEPLPSLQWFINVDKKISKYKKSIKELSVEAVKTGFPSGEGVGGVSGKDKIRIIPERFEKSYFNWMDNLHDWCISRQIWFGHQIPVWYNGEDIYVGVEPPEKIPLSPLTEGGTKEIDSGEDYEWTQDTDTLDTWFSSGMWTFTTMAKNAEQIRLENGKLIIDSEDFKNFHPTAVLETGYDILFFWVARMIIMTTYAIGDIPFKDVYLHGLIRDENGKKMSKSLGNVIDPLDMIEKYGTDAVRLALVIGTTPGNDMNLSEEKIAGFRNFTNKLWNIARYVQNCYDKCHTVEGDTAWEEYEFTVSDTWILGKLERILENVTQAIENYEFSQAGEMLREFTWNDFADWYIEISKFEKGEEKERILKMIMQDLLKLWHPFMPFVTEKIWEEMGNEKMLIVEEWPKQENKKIIKQKNKNIDYDFELVKDIIISIRNVRAKYNIKPYITIANGRAQDKIQMSQKIKAIIYAGDKKELLESQAELIKKLRTGISELEIKEKGPKIRNAIYIAEAGIEIYLVIPDFDFKAETERLEKEIMKQEKLVDNQKNKLTNTNFVQRAPEAVVKGEKDKLATWESDLAKIREQLEHLR